MVWQLYNNSLFLLIPIRVVVVVGGVELLITAISSFIERSYSGGQC